jgi:transposase
MSADEKVVHDVVLLASQGVSRRAISRALKVSRNTVRRVLGGHDAARSEPHTALPAPKTIARPSRLDAFRPRIDGLFATFPDITAQRVFEELRDAGFDGGYTAVKVLVRRIRPKPSVTPSLVTPVYGPGEMAECDWSEYRVEFTQAPARKLQAFGYTLRHSTRKCFSFHQRNDLFALMDGHVRAFQRIEGAARRCKYDNQKPVVLRWEGAQPIFNPRFIDFATYYEFQPVACHPRRPNEKPRVERSFWELTLSFFRGRKFRDEADLKAQLSQWMDTICDLRPLKRMKRRTRLELFEEERPLLRSLPRHPYDTARVLYKLCDIEGFIAWDGNRYSLPYEYVTEILPVRVTEKELWVYKPDLSCIARHELKPRGAGEVVTLPGHRPRLADRGPDLCQLRRTFAEMGEPAQGFLAALEKAQPRSGAYHARRILALRAGFDTADLVRALAHALAYGALEHGAVERILVARAPARRLDEYAAETTAHKLERLLARSNTEPRDLAEYDALPPQGQPPQPEGEPTCPSEASPRQAEPPLTNAGSESASTSIVSASPGSTSKHI